MKSLTILLLCVGIFNAPVFGQSGDESDYKNIVKINLAALTFKSVSIQYERAVGERVSLAGTIKFMPKGKLPFRNTISDLADDAELDRQLANTEVGNFSIMPEMRYYLGKKGVLQGFYIGPFINFSRYNARLLYEYDDLLTTKTIPLSGDVNTFTGGFMIGAQWKLARSVSLDWWILGPNYGISKGNLNGRQALTPSEQQSLRNELADLDIPLTKFTYTVDGNGANIDFKGPWAGIRAGLAIGINF